MSWVGALTIFLMLISLIFGYSRYSEYENEVQRGLYENLVGRTYPHFSDEYDGDEFRSQVINVSAKRSGLKNWETIVVLKFDMEEFPWEGENIDDWDYDTSVLESAAQREDIDSIEDAMEKELLNLCQINRSIGPKFRPRFSNSAYGPVLFLHFDTIDLFILTEQLEMVSEVLPFVFATWYQTLIGLDAETTLFAGALMTTKLSE